MQPISNVNTQYINKAMAKRFIEKISQTNTIAQNTQTTSAVNEAPKENFDKKIIINIATLVAAVGALGLSGRNASALNKYIQESQANIGSLTKEITTLSTNVNKLIENQASLDKGIATKLETMKSNISELMKKADTTGIQEALEAISEKVDGIAKSKDISKKSFETISNKISELTQTVADLSGKMSELANNSKNTSKESLEAIGKNINELMQSIGGLSKKMDEIANSKDNTASTLEIAEKSIEELIKKADISGESAKIQEILDMLSKKTDTIENSKGSSRDELEVIRKSIENIAKSLSGLSGKVDEISNSKNSTTATLETIKNSIEELIKRPDMSGESAKIQETLEGLSKQLNEISSLELNSDKENLKQILDDLKALRQDVIKGNNNESAIKLSIQKLEEKLSAQIASLSASKIPEEISTPKYVSILKAAVEKQLGESTNASQSMLKNALKLIEKQNNVADISKIEFKKGIPYIKGTNQVFSGVISDVTKGKESKPFEIFYDRGTLTASKIGDVLKIYGYKTKGDVKNTRIETFVNGFNSVCSIRKAPSEHKFALQKFLLDPINKLKREIRRVVVSDDKYTRYTAGDGPYAELKGSIKIDKDLAERISEYNSSSIENCDFEMWDAFKGVPGYEKYLLQYPNIEPEIKTGILMPQNGKRILIPNQDSDSMHFVNVMTDKNDDFATVKFTENKWNPDGRNFTSPI